MGPTEFAQAVYRAAALAGMLPICTWNPSWGPEDGSGAQSHPVGFSCPDQSVLEGLALSTDYAMTYPATAFVGLAPREQVQIGPHTYSVREVRSQGDGSERRASLTQV